MKCWCLDVRVGKPRWARLPQVGDTANLPFFNLQLLSIRLLFVLAHSAYVRMDRRIFDQLNMLERGARVEMRRSHPEYDHSSAEYSAHGMPEEAAYDDFGGYEYGRGYQFDQHEFFDEPMVLDSFGE